MGKDGRRKLFLISVVKNEEDIIESFVRYHAAIFDGLVIMDNRSTDDTVNILKQLAAEGLPLYLSADDEASHVQDIKMNRLLSVTLERFDPDIVVPLDADEFLVPSVPGSSVRQVMESIDLTKVGLVSWVTHIFTEQDDPTRLFVPARINRIVLGEKALQKVILPAGLTRERALRITMGNHSVTANAEPEKKVYGMNVELKLAHYPWRSMEHAKSKALVGWTNTLAKPERFIDEGYHWQLMYDKVRQNAALSYGELIREVLKYTTGDEGAGLGDSPFKYDDIQIKYTQNRPVNYLNNFANNSALLAQSYAVLKNKALSNVRMGYALLDSLYKRNMSQEALKVVDMLSLFDSNPILLFIRAESLVRLQKYDEAGEIYKKFLAANNIDKFAAEKQRAQAMLTSLADK